MSDDGDAVTPPRPRPRPGPVDRGPEAEETAPSEVLPDAPLIEDVAGETSSEEPAADQSDASGVDSEAELSAEDEADVSPEADSGSAASAPEPGMESSSESESESESEPETVTWPELEPATGTDGEGETEASVTGEAEAELPSEIPGDDESGDTSVEDSSAVPTPPVAPGPVSAASRARRIGGRPTVSTGGPSQPGDGEPTPRRRPSPPPPGTGRHVAAPPAAPKKERAKKDRPAKESTAPKPARTPKEPKAGRDLSSVAWIPSFLLGAAALALVVIIAIAAHGVYYGKDSVSAGQRNEYQEQALAAAKTCLATINTYDYRKLDADEKSALACTTGAFTAALKTTFDKTLKVKAPPAKAIQTAQVNEAGISEVTSNGKQIQILIYGQLSVTNVDTGSTPRYDPFGTVVTVDNVGGNWLIASYTSPTGS